MTTPVVFTASAVPFKQRHVPCSVLTYEYGEVDVPCSVLTYEYGEVDEGHIRNEMRNLKTFRENLYPEWRFRGVGGFTKLDMTGGGVDKIVQ